VLSTPKRETIEDSAFWNFKRASDEEIRNFFVALSRAKQRAIFTFTKVRNKKSNTANDIRSLYGVLSESKLVEVVDHRSSDEYLIFLTKTEGENNNHLL
jgi:superfamily I DNA/RNA helicase